MSIETQNNNHQKTLALRSLHFLSPRTFGGLLVVIAIAAVAVAVAFLTHNIISKQREIAVLKKIVSRLEAEQRVAQVLVRNQKTDASGRVLETTLKFVEINDKGQPFSEKIITVPGEEVYFDALVMKFDREHVKLGDPLRGKSVYLFRKIFGSSQKPENGFSLDLNSTDGIPDSYRTSLSISAFEKKLWQRFWEFANDPVAARKEGVRVAQIEAIGTRPVRGKIYTITLELPSGLNITAQAIPAILQGESLATQ